MAVPKKRKSKSKRDMRRAHHALKMPSLATCPQCHEPVLPHRACRECGTYKGRTVIQTEES